MFEYNPVERSLSRDEVLSQVSEYDIFKKYCKNFKDINIGFLSEFYDDGKPSCYIYQDSNNRLKYKDHGSSEHLDCFSYVMKKYSCTFKESLKIISSDFGISSLKISMPIEYAVGVDVKSKNTPKQKPRISIIPRNWSIYDHDYWVKKYDISFKLLDEYNVIPLQYCYLHKGENTIVFKFDKTNPMYAYKFVNEDGTYSYKIYWPLSKNKKFKWLFSGGVKENIEGFDQLPLFDDRLIITKSLKDVICFKMIGYNAISLQGESNKLEKEFLYKISKRFDDIIIFYDNDEKGFESAKSITNSYGLKSYFIPDEFKPIKDLSDLIENYGLETSKEIIDKIINE